MAGMCHWTRCLRFWLQQITQMNHCMCTCPCLANQHDSFTRVSERNMILTVIVRAWLGPVRGGHEGGQMRHTHNVQFDAKWIISDPGRFKEA